MDLRDAYDSCIDGLQVHLLTLVLLILQLMMISLFLYVSE